MIKKTENSENIQRVTMAHGSGGMDSHILMRDIFAPCFANEILDALEDAAVIDIPSFSHLPSDPKMVVSTDSFVVEPLFFQGGDIGKLAVCGSLNDVLMMGAIPRYISLGAVLEVGLPLDELRQIVSSMADILGRENVIIIAGDTKVIEHSGEKEPGLILNTTCIGFVEPSLTADMPRANRLSPGDKVLVSGNLGDHHACILAARMGIKNDISSDCAVLSPITKTLYANGIFPVCMRDITRGGLATVLNELATSSNVDIEINDLDIPVGKDVLAFCGLLGLDPLYMGNEGKLVAVIKEEDADKALSILRELDIANHASIIGEVIQNEDKPRVYSRTSIGSRRLIDMLYGEGLPRIC